MLFGGCRDPKRILPRTLPLITPHTLPRILPRILPHILPQILPGGLCTHPTDVSNLQAQLTHHVHARTTTSCTRACANMLPIAVLISLSIVNSVFLILTIWARFNLAHIDWWAVFLVAFIMGFLYQLKYSELAYLL